MDESALNIDRALLERINPVFNTAKMTMFQLAASGDPDASAISARLGLTQEGTQGVTEPDELLLNMIILETRFRTMGALAEKEPSDTKVDLPCGYTPRAIEFARKGIPFVGLDLPAAIEEGKGVITSMIDADKRSLVRFEGVDATNYDSLKKVFDEIEGEVCITTEGLLMYFTDSETGELCDNIRRILSAHGGCWITADPETAIQYVLMAQAVFGDRFMEVLLKGKQRAEEKSDVEVASRTLVVDPSDPEENMKKAMQFLAAHGLKAERMIVKEHVPQLKSLAKASPGQADAVLAAMSRFAYWKITPIRAEQIDTQEAKGEFFDVSAEFVQNGLNLHLYGRLDTLSAPGLLALYEKTVGMYTIDEAVIDCRDLEYISSAGLRVLMIMQKRCKKGLILTGINDSVREILKQTAFDTLLNIR